MTATFRARAPDRGAPLTARREPRGVPLALDAVRVGRRPGLYPTWEEAEAQVKGYPGAEHRSFTDQLAAEAGVEVSGGGAALALTADERTELLELRQRVRQLEAERDEIEHRLGDLLSPEQQEQLGLHSDGHNHMHYH